MIDRLGPLFVLLTGGMILRLSVTGEYLNYVRPGMLPWLLASSVLLMAVGTIGIGSRINRRITAMRERWESEFTEDGSPPIDHHAPGDGCAAGDEHSHGTTRAAWLLLVPVLVVVIFPTKPLGTFAANRGKPDLPVTTKAASFSSSSLAASIPPPVEGAEEMSILDFLDKTYYDPEKTLAGVPVTIIGFVAPSDRPNDNFLLTRFLISCCAADARPVQVAVVGYDGYVPGPDTWVEVTGSWIPEPEGSKPRLGSDGFPLPHLKTLRVAPIPPPAYPYATFSDPGP